MDDKRYFAALPLYGADISKSVMEKVNKWFEELPSWWVYKRAKRVWQLANGLPGEVSPFDVSVIGKAGEEGELSQVHFNLAGNMLHRTVTLVAAKLPAVKPVTVNRDPHTQESAIICASVFEMERRKNDLPRHHRNAVQAAFTTFLGWQYVGFDPRGGGKFDVGGSPMMQPGAMVVGPDGQPTQGPPTPSMGPDGQPMMTPPTYFGALEYETYCLWDVIWNRWGKNRRWAVRKKFWNRHELIARFPKEEERILNLPADTLPLQKWRERVGQRMDKEEVPVYILHHPESEACPNGRETWVVDDKLPLFDSVSIYKDKLPLIPLTPTDVVGTKEPHSYAGDWIAPQQALNMLASSAITNMAAGGVANYSVPKDADLDIWEAANGANIFETDPSVGEVKALAGATSPPELYKLWDVITGTMQQLAGMSDTTMGKVDAGMPASGMALMDAKSQEFASLFQAAAISHVVEVYNLILHIYQHCITTPRQLEVTVGEDQRYLIDGFTGDRLKGIPRVQVEVTDPMFDTTSGKMALVDQLGQHGALGDGPEARRSILEIYRTGKVEPALNGPEAQMRLIQYENAAMRQGQVPQVRINDPHGLHFITHETGALPNPEARADPKVSQCVDEHQQMHLSAITAYALRFVDQPDPMTGQMKKVPLIGPPDPAALAALLASGQEPINVVAALAALMPPPGPTPPSAEAPHPGPSAGAPPPHPPQHPGPPPQAGHGAPGGPPGGPPMPLMPMNPSTGQRVPAPPPPPTP